MTNLPRTISFLLMLWLCACSSKPYLLIKNVTVFDGQMVHEKVHVVIGDTLLLDVSEDLNPRVYDQVIDGTGMTILPPLLNAHVHVRSPENLQEALHSGVFGLLDMFSTDQRAQYLRSFNDSLRYSRFYSSNVGATVAGGHGTQFGVSIPVISDSLSGKTFVNNRIALGADYIKITHEQSMARMQPAQIKEITQTAEKHQKKVIGHISALTDGLDLITNGVHGLAHIWYRAGSIANQEQLKTIADRQAFIIPTLSVIEKVLERAKEIGVEDQYLSMEEVQLEVRKAHEAGIRILAGTDAPNYGLNYSTQLFEELALLKACGIADQEILKMVTSNIYESFELKAFEKLEAGSPASFILVDGQPHKNILHLKANKRIWKNGIEIAS